MTMHGIPKAEDIALRILLGPNVIDQPLADVENLNIDRLVSDDLSDAFHPLFMSRRYVWLVARHRKHDKYPLLPRLHHARKADPGKVWVVHVVLITPVQVALSMFDESAQVCFDKDVPCQTSSRVFASAAGRVVEEPYFGLHRHQTNSCI